MFAFILSLFRAICTSIFTLLRVSPSLGLLFLAAAEMVGQQVSNGQRRWRVMCTNGDYKALLMGGYKGLEIDGHASCYALPWKNNTS